MKLNGYMLGQLEEFILLLIAAKGYSNPKQIVDDFHDLFDKSISKSALHTALRRLEGKGYLISELGPKTPKRGGKARKNYRITAIGIDTLIFFREKKNQLFKDLIAKV